MKTIGDLLETKGRGIWSVSPGTTVYRALEILADKNIGALLVLEEGRLVGIFSERDYARKVILKGRSSREITVGELMTTQVYFATPANTLFDAMALMTSRNIRHLPVIERGQLLGIVTLGDVVKKIISEQATTIRELENYITGG